ncbi:MAG: nitroreductase family protein [Candidatus Aenigmatarchaeota archaeon]
MEVFTAIKKRHSVRSFEDKEIPKEKILKILESGRLAPSAQNIQPWHFIVVTENDKKKEIAKSQFGKFLKDCSAIIVGCGDKKASPKWYKVDVSIAMENMILAAVSLGLGTCWVGSFDEKEVKKLLKIPEKFEIVALIALGYEKKKIDLQGKFLHLIRRRKELKEIASFNEFGRF